MKPFHSFLIRPGLGFCRGVLPYNASIILLTSLWGLVCHAEGYEGQFLAYTAWPSLVMAIHILFRRRLLPPPVCEAYDAFLSDIIEELSAPSFSELRAHCLEHIVEIVHFVTDIASSYLWLIVSLLEALLLAIKQAVESSTRAACDFIALRRYLLLTETHSVRAPSAVL
jgi:hypothetical protein